MAIVHITTTYGAVPPEEQITLAAELGALTYAAEGFLGSRMASTLTWTFFDERPSRAFQLAAGDPAAPLYYLQVTTLAGALDTTAKQKLGEALTRALIAREGRSLTPDNLTRVWVRFIDVTDGDLIVGGESTSLAGLKALVAQAG